jgi:hypothetical protein
VDIASAPPAECFEVSWLFVDVRFDEVPLVRDDFNEVGPWFVFCTHDQIVPLAVPSLQVVGRVPHFSRSLREVGFFADTLPTLSQCSVEFSPPAMFRHDHVSDHDQTAANAHQIEDSKHKGCGARIAKLTDECWNYPLAYRGGLAHL